ncbi:DNA-damage-inducible protein F [Pseudomonas sp. CFII64]|uniref:MATE family efflux transporter n=1 Tax=Pseudomonas sp. CFII64 TaxID=911242 RepID=UPI0003581849|nr:MATE family efflux transporter [Pseudomonas sp. CFII64]EPJ79658.1 DNA-damage-inducible protein F [Pseudomonas sp. CFII64]
MSTLLNDWRHRTTHQRVWALAAPMILSNISVPLVALVDSAVIGHLPHAHQLGAVAVGATLYTFLAWTMGFLRMGTTGFASQAAGRGDGAALRQILVQGLLLAMGLALLLGVIGLPFSHLALTLMQPSADLQQLTEAFFHTRLFGLPASLAGYALVGWFLGTQNAKAPLAILLTTNLVNIALNLWFVIGLDWGVVGSARASVVAEWTGALLGLALTQRTLRDWPGQLAWSALKLWQNWRPLLAVNRDIFIRSLALQSVFFLITVQGARLGDATVAANALLLNGLLLTAHALDGLAHAVEALCGHAIGARDRSALRRSLTVAGGWSLIASVAFALLFAVAGHLFIQMQTDIPEVRDTAFIYLPYLAALPLLAVASYLLDGLFIGATRAREMRNAMLLSVVIIAPIAYAAQNFGNHGLWLTLLLFMLIRGATLSVTAWRLSKTGEWFSGPAH